MSRSKVLKSLEWRFYRTGPVRNSRPTASNIVYSALVANTKPTSGPRRRELRKSQHI